MAITLPTSKIPAETQDPRYLILFGLPKAGKTTILSTLENNLILDTENGSTYVDALKVKVNSLKEIKDKNISKVFEYQLGRLHDKKEHNIQYVIEVYPQINQYNVMRFVGMLS